MQILQRIDNIDVLCTDIAKMATFYHEVLGQPFLFPHSPDDDWFAVQAGDVTLYFFPGTGQHPARFTAVTEENPPGIECFAFAVRDLDEAIAELDGKVEWAGDVSSWEHPGGTRYRYRYFYDPEGNKMAVTEPRKA
jgi:catechol 2,3-dioxygenase-like lactoylglutathione lyase family enzyme